MNIKFAVILVDSTSHALRTEKLIKRLGLTCKLIPVPRHIGSDCGVCVRILFKELDIIKTLVTQNNINIQSIEVL